MSTPSGAVVAPKSLSLLEVVKKAAVALVTMAGMCVDVGLVTDYRIRLLIAVLLTGAGTFGVYQVRNAALDSGTVTSDPALAGVQAQVAELSGRFDARENLADAVQVAVGSAVSSLPTPQVTVNLHASGDPHPSQGLADTIAGTFQAADPGSSEDDGPAPVDNPAGPVTQELPRVSRDGAPTAELTPARRPRPFAVTKLTERTVPGQRLGRHVEHDPRSRNYDVANDATVPTAISSVLWTRRVAPFDQGDIGSCTGNAEAGMLATDSKARQGRASFALGAVITDPVTGKAMAGTVPVDEKLAVALYALNTRLDAVPGDYPSQDTGSTGLAIGKALVQIKGASGYRHAFSIGTMQRALQLGPVAIGIPWYAGFDRPDASGLVRRSGAIRGGHEIEVIGMDLDKSEFILPQSWGQQWTTFVPPNCAGSGGYFRMGFGDMIACLSNQGDVLAPTLT